MVVSSRWLTPSVMPEVDVRHKKKAIDSLLETCDWRRTRLHCNHATQNRSELGATLVVGR